MPSSNSSERDILNLEPGLNSFKILKELLASSNNEGMIDGEYLLDVLLTFPVLLSPLHDELAISLSVSVASPANH